MMFIKIEPSIDHGSDIEVAARSQGVDMLNFLQNEKVTLEIQNSTLKAQFEKAIELANQSKSLQSQLIQQKEENRKLIEQIEIQNAQLELLSSSNNDLTRKLDDERKKAAEQITSKLDYSRQENIRMKNKFQQRLDQLEVENEELRRSICEWEATNREDQFNLKKAKSLLSNIFCTKFQTLTNAFAYAEHHQPPEVNKVADDTQVNGLLADLASCKSKIKSEIKKRKQMEKASVSLTRQLKAASDQLVQLQGIEKEAETLRKKLSHAESEHSLVVADIEHQVGLLKTRNEKLVQEFINIK